MNQALLPIVRTLSLVAVFSTLMLSHAQAQVIPHFQGQYKFDSQIFPHRRIRTELIYTSVPSGHERHRMLVRKNFDCQLASLDILRCTREEPLAMAPARIIDRVRQAFDQLEVRFDEVTGPIQLTNRTATLEQWYVPQKAVVSGQAYSGYSYIRSHERERLEFQAARGANPETFVLSSDGQTIQREVEETVSGPNRQDTYLLYLDLGPI